MQDRQPPTKRRKLHRTASRVKSSKSRSRGKEENDDDSIPDTQQHSKKDNDNEIASAINLETSDTDPVSEQFTEHGQFMVLSEERKTVQYQTPMPDIVNPFDFNSAYGQMKANSHDKVHKYRWTFKVIPKSGGSGNCAVSIGIDSSNKEYSSTNFCGNDYRRNLKQNYSDHSNGTFYALMSRSFGSKVECVAMSHRISGGEYGEIFHMEPSEVVMELDVSQKVLRYYVDKKALGIAFKDILFRDQRSLQYIEYTMCVSAGGSDIDIELVDFEKVMMTKMETPSRRYGRYERRMKMMRQRKRIESSRKRSLEDMMSSQ